MGRVEQARRLGLTLVLADKAAEAYEARGRAMLRALDALLEAERAEEYARGCERLIKDVVWERKRA